MVKKEKLITLGTIVNILLGIVLYGFFFIGIFTNWRDYSNDAIARYVLNWILFLLVVYLQLAIYYSSVIFRSSHSNFKTDHTMRTLLYCFTGPIGYTIFTAELYDKNQKEAVALQIASPLAAFVKKSSTAFYFYLALAIIFTIGFFISINNQMNFRMLDTADNPFDTRLYSIITTAAGSIWCYFEALSYKKGEPNKLSRDAGALASWLVLVLFILMLFGIYWYVKTLQ